MNLSHAWLNCERRLVLAEGRRLVRGGDYTEGMAMFDSGLLRLNSARRLVSTPERREGRNEHYGANLEEGAGP